MSSEYPVLGERGNYLVKLVASGKSHIRLPGSTVTACGRPVPGRVRSSDAENGLCRACCRSALRSSLPMTYPYRMWLLRTVDRR